MSLFEYQLVHAGPEGIRVLDVPQRRGSFDVSVGRAAPGRWVLTYSRCSDGCRLFEYDLSTGSERRLPAGVPLTEQAWPVRWGDRLVFAGPSADGRSESGGLYLRRIGEQRPHRLRAGTTPRRGTVTGLALRGRRVLFTWSFSTEVDGCGQGTPDRLSYATQDEVWLARIGGMARLADRTCRSHDPATRLSSPSLAGGRPTYSVEWSTAEKSLRAIGATLRDSGPLMPYPISTATTARHLYAVVGNRDSSAYGLDLVRGPLPAMRPARPLRTETLFGPAPGFTKPFGPVPDR